MALIDFCRTEVVTIPLGASIAESAKLMKQKNVGSVVIIDDSKPVGILTDRDIAVRVVAEGKDPESTKVSEVMTENLETLNENLGLFQALERMEEVGVRRFPIVNDRGELVGIITLDDVLYILGKEMSDVATTLKKESPRL